MGFCNSRSLEGLNQRPTKESAMTLVRVRGPREDAVEKYTGPFDVGPNLGRVLGRKAEEA